MVDKKKKKKKKKKMKHNVLWETNEILDLDPKVLAESSYSLRKQAYSNILKIFTTKNWKFSDKNSDFFHISAQNIDCGYSLELP